MRKLQKPTLLGLWHAVSKLTRRCLKQTTQDCHLLRNTEELNEPIFYMMISLYQLVGLMTSLPTSAAAEGLMHWQPRTICPTESEGCCLSAQPATMVTSLSLSP